MITTKEYTFPDGPDEGKTFVISTMPIQQGDSWSNRVAIALCGSGVSISHLFAPDAEGKIGFVGMLDVASCIDSLIKMLGGVDPEKVDELVAVLMQNVKLKLADGSVRNPVMDVDISHISTFRKLRSLAFNVNIDFLAEGVIR